MNSTKIVSTKVTTAFFSSNFWRGQVIVGVLGGDMNMYDENFVVEVG
jgi:hypothetical protein